MKKMLSGLLAVILALVVITVFRAFTVFEDRQLEPLAALPEVTLDENAVVNRMAAAIRLRTISHDDRSNFDADAFLAFHEHLRTSFPRVYARAQVETVNDYSLLFHIQGSDASLKPIMLMGHTDVVPVDDVTLAKWTHDPFGGEIVDGMIWGRGTIDDKLSVMSFLEAVEALLRDGFEPRRSLYLSFGHDEEVGGMLGGMCAAWPPSAVFTVTSGEMATMISRVEGLFSFSGMVVGVGISDGCRRPPPGVSCVCVCDSGKLGVARKISHINGTLR